MLAFSFKPRKVYLLSGIIGTGKTTIGNYILNHFNDFVFLECSHFRKGQNIVSGLTIDENYYFDIKYKIQDEEDNDVDWKNLRETAAMYIGYGYNVLIAGPCYVNKHIKINKTIVLSYDLRNIGDDNISVGRCIKKRWPQTRNSNYQILKAILSYNNDIQKNRKYVNDVVYVTLQNGMSKKINDVLSDVIVKFGLEL